jgi:hypothetical protein
MSHLVPALLLLMFTPPTHTQPASLPDAPSAQLQPQAPAPFPPASSPQAPSTPPPTTPDPHWLRVEQLPLGKAIAVLERGREYPTSCNMDLANDTTLTCTQASPYSPPRRLVFPMGNIAAVFTEEVQSGPSLTALLVGLGIGAGLGAGVCNEGSARTILACSLLGAGIGAGVTLNPSPLPHPPRIHRRLIYRAP